MRIGSLVKRNDSNCYGIVVKRLKYTIASDRWSYRVKWLCPHPSGKIFFVDGDGWRKDSWQLEVVCE